MYIRYIMYIEVTKFYEMRKNIDIDDKILTKLKLLSAFEGMSVKSVIEKAVVFYVEYKESERLKTLSADEKEDLGLLLLMQQSDRNEVASREEVMSALD